jgi:hypothetical protein
VPAALSPSITNMPFLEWSLPDNCICMKALITKGAIIHNHEGRVCLPDGLQVPNISVGANLVDHVDRYYATMKPPQSYYGAFEEQQLAKLKKELKLNQRESTLLAKQLKLETNI